MIYNGKGRPPSRFCSRKCKDKIKHEEKRAAKVAEIGERRCPVCENVIPDTVTLKAVCCSRECGITHQNRIKAGRKIKEFEDRNPLCERCGLPIPAGVSRTKLIGRGAGQAVRVSITIIRQEKFEVCSAVSAIRDSAVFRMIRPDSVRRLPTLIRGD